MADDVGRAVCGERVVEVRFGFHGVDLVDIFHEEAACVFDGVIVVHQTRISAKTAKN